MQFRNLCTFVFLAGSLCFGGWYECYNFEGTVGKYPVAVSLQIMGRAFSQKHVFDVNGNYRYRRTNTPILLRGTYDVRTSRMKLYEYSENLINGTFHSLPDSLRDSTAVFEFDFDTSTIQGNWTNLKTDRILPLHLNFISRFDDKSSTATDIPVAIPQSFSTEDKYFVGEYAYDPDNDSRGRMVCLKIYDKKTDSLFQNIDFSNCAVSMGNVSTSIHTNVSITENGFWIWADVGKMGTEIDFRIKGEKNRYELTEEDKALLE